MTKISLKITYLKFYSTLPGANQLTVTAPGYEFCSDSYDFMWWKY